MRSPDRVRARVQKIDLYTPPSVASVGRIQYAPTIGYVRSFEIPMRSPNRVCARVQKIDLYSSPSGPSVGRIRYAPTTGYVRSFKIPMRSPNRVRARVQKIDLYSFPSSSRCGAYAICPYNRLRVTLRNTDAIFQLNTCGPSKNCPVFVLFEPAV